MKILMFGWEYPPTNSGGLGVACEGIVGGLAEHGHQVYLVLPQLIHQSAVSTHPNLSLLSCDDCGEVHPALEIPHYLYSAYSTVTSYRDLINKLEQEDTVKSLYGADLFAEIKRYALKSALHARKVPHDVIHAHDWLTAEAGIMAKKFSGKPLVMHIHATEIDRSGDHPNQEVYQMEKRGMDQADRIIAVSNYTKHMIIKYYGISGRKIDVVHNAVKPNFSTYHKSHHLNQTDKIVLFLGRMTMQKGPDYFLRMAQKVLEQIKRVKFVMAGDGDMMNQVIHMANQLGIERNVLFAGFLQGEEVKRAYAFADLYVMPSVSEPFGIAPLEAIQQGTPVLISRQAGINEVIKNALRVDFWDIEEMANKVVAVLQYEALHKTLQQQSQLELQRINWHKQARHISSVYEKVTKPS